MKIQEHHLWLALAFAVALVAAYLSQGILPSTSGTDPTAGLSAYVADTGAGLIFLLVVGGVATLVLWWRGRGEPPVGGEPFDNPYGPGPDEPERARHYDAPARHDPASSRPTAEADAWERATHEICGALLGGIRLQPERASEEAREVIERLKARAREASTLARERERLEAQVEELFAELDAQDEQHQHALSALRAQLDAAKAEEGPTLTDVLEAITTFRGETVRQLIAHFQDYGIQVPRAVKDRRGEEGSLLVQLLQLLPSPTMGDTPVHGIPAVVNGERAVNTPVNAPVNSGDRAVNSPVHSGERAVNALVNTPRRARVETEETS